MICSQLRTQSASTHPVVFGLNRFMYTDNPFLFSEICHMKHFKPQNSKDVQQPGPPINHMHTTTGKTIFFPRVSEYEMWASALDNAQRSIATHSNILCETVKEGLWGISSQGICSETSDSVNFSLYIKSHWSRTKEQLQIRSTKTPLWELQSELMSTDTHFHTVFLPGLSCTVANNTSL